MKLLSIAQHILGQSIPVLCYHQVRPNSGMTPAKFGQHLDMISKMGFKSIRLDHLHKIITRQEPQDGPFIVITFDDCTLDNWTYAVPELLHRGMHGVFFAITDFLVQGRIRPRSDQAAQESSLPPMEEIMRRAIKGDCSGFMNVEELRALIHETGMEAYSHSAAHQACFINSDRAGVLGDNRHWSHEHLCGPDCAPETIVHPVGSAYAQGGFGRSWDGCPLAIGTREERLAFCVNDFSRSKSRLEEALDIACPFLCLPWGEYDEVTLEAAKKSGFDALLTLDRARIGAGTDPMRIGRRAIKDGRSLFELTIRVLRDAVRNQ